MDKIFIQTISSHIEQVAKEDSVFAQKYSQRKLLDKNCMIQCCSYIINEVKKSGRNAFANEEIYGMAIHFFDENLTNDGKAPAVKVVVPAKDKGKSDKAKPAKPARRSSTQDECQLSLF